MFNVTLDGVKWENPLLTVFFPHLLYISPNLMFISPNLLVFCFINWRKDEGGVFLWKHLLDFVRASLIPPSHPDHMHYNNPSHVIHCVSKLRQAGIKLKPGKATSLVTVCWKCHLSQWMISWAPSWLIAWLMNNATRAVLSTWQLIRRCWIAS